MGIGLKRTQRRLDLRRPEGQAADEGPCPDLGRSEHHSDHGNAWDPLSRSGLYTGQRGLLSSLLGSAIDTHRTEDGLDSFVMMRILRTILAPFLQVHNYV